MKVLGINGSARKDGNTAILIQTVFDELTKEGIETELIQLSENRIEGCKACRSQVWYWQEIKGYLNIKLEHPL
ncbi:NAD(P)H-dependent oxidoreductase [Methanosarcina mazei]